MPLSGLTHHANEALLLTAALSMPVVGVGAIVGLFVAALQAATQIQDATIAHLPRLLSVIAVMVFAGPWMGAQIAMFAERLFLAAAQ